jgi:hypothetical protein
MFRRRVALLLLLGALALVLAPALIAGLALLRGEHEAALDAFWPVFLVPLAFLIFGLVSSFRRNGTGDSRRPRRDRNG